MGQSKKRGTGESTRATLGKAKVKTGCRTCKSRRVKCDESRPACRRCISTGRVCEGYGIWGGGGNAYASRQPLPRDDFRPRPGGTLGMIEQLRHRMPVPGVLTADESRSFEWFMCRTATKIPGCFTSDFWDTLVLQASCTEPAVWHAVLALSSAHRRDCLGRTLEDAKRRNAAPDQLELFTLQHYTKAIWQLQPHFATRSRTSIRVALITCVVFGCMEFLRGRYKTGHDHLQSGMKLLRDVPNLDADGLADANSHREPVDDWLVETLSRFNLQAALFGQIARPQHPPQASHSTPMPVIFTSIGQARRRLDHLLDQAFHLESYCLHQGVSLEAGCQPPSERLLNLRRCIQVDLALWSKAFAASRTNVQAQVGIAVFKVASQVLRLYYTMATIMAATCLQPGDEMAYDFHTTDFASMINEAITALNVVLSSDLSDTPFEQKQDMSHFITDLGWIPMVYYIALKCRIHRVRLHAIKLLNAIHSKEGIWDAPLAASIARRVMDIEEAGFYNHGPKADDFAHDSPLTEDDLVSPNLPQAHRVREVQVLLPDGPSDSTTLICRRIREDGTWEVLASERDTISGDWRTITRGESAIKTVL